jgi:hypothetical protein
VSTFDVFSLDGFDGDVGVISFVVAFEDVAVLAWADLALEDVVVNYFGHGGYLNCEDDYITEQVEMAIGKEESRERRNRERRGNYYGIMMMRWMAEEDWRYKEESKGLFMCLPIKNCN